MSGLLVMFATEVVPGMRHLMPNRPAACSITSLEGSVAEARQCATVGQRPLLPRAMSLQDERAALLEFRLPYKAAAEDS